MSASRSRGIILISTDKDSELVWKKLCASFVISVSLWWIYWEYTHHRDTEDTKVAQRKASVTKLLAEVCFLDARIGGKLFRRSFHDDAAGLEHVSPIRVFQGRVCILFDQQDGCALTLDLINRFEDGMDHERRQAERRLIKQQQSWLRH